LIEYGGVEPPVRISIDGAPYSKRIAQTAEINVIAANPEMKAVTTHDFPRRLRRGIKNPPPKPKMKMLSG
jgi:hypothetical protein